MNQEERALNIGGGIAGLTTAIALRRAGIEAVVFERADDVRKLQVGGGFTMWPNSMRALQHLGLAEAVLEAGAPFEEAEFATSGGTRLVHWPVGTWARSNSTRSGFINRGDLIRVPLDAVEHSMLQLGAECTDFSEDDGGVTARSADGREERGALLVGADAGKSVIRAQLYGPVELQYVGYTVWHGYVSDPERDPVRPGLFRVTYGRATRFNYHHVGQGHLFWQSIANVSPGQDPADVDLKAMIRERHRGWAEPVPSAIQASDEHTIFRMDILTRPPSRQWGAGRVTLIGDAAHPILFNLGQGAAQSVEDAIVLTRNLKQQGLEPAALRDYESQRMDRALGVQKMSKLLGQVGQLQNPVACWIRNQAVRLVFNTIARREQEKDAAFQV